MVHGHEDEADAIYADETEDARLHSEDWRLILHEDEHGFLCDFNGWPGDNESGAGVYYGIETESILWLFDNEDTQLCTSIAELEETIKGYEPYRLISEV